MKTGRNRFFGLLLCMALGLMLLPGIFPKAYAASTDVKTIQMDSYNDQFNIRGGGANWLYFGNYNGSPVKWRVLSTTLNGTCSYSGKGLFLMSEPMLGNMIYCSSSSVCAYSDSNVHAACASLYNGGNSCFTAQERGAVLSTTKGTDASVSLDNAAPLQGCGLNGEYLYALSAAEATNADYGFAVDGDTSDPSRENESSWWLRSPTTYDAGFVDRPGELNYCAPNYYLFTYGVRPACNLALSEALFASPAVGGKVSGAVGSDALTSVGARTVNEWKLTLLDSENRILTLYDGPVVGGPGYTTTISYQAYCYENPGKNEYISAIITDSEGNPLYYGRLTQITTDQYEQVGNVSLTVPAGIAAGKYTIKYFMEQYNGDYETDYASNFANVSLAVLPTVTNVTVPASRIYKAGDSLDFTASFNSSVTVEGTPYLPVTVGDKQACAYYISGSGSNKLVFRYTAAVGDNDADGIVLGDSIVLNGGTIKGGTMDAQLYLNNSAATTGIKVDTTAPEVTSLTPENLATNIPTSGNMEITFSEAMSAAAGTVTLSVDGGSPKNLGGGSWINGNMYRIPYSGLDCSTEYTVTVGGFKDAVGNGMESGHTGSFTTEARPTVQSVTPAKRATNVLTSGRLIVAFSRAMATGHGAVSLNGETLTGGSWTNDMTYSITYSGLDCSTPYTIEISGFQDTRGNAILDNTDYSFTTEARPAVQSVAPADGTVGVLASGSLTVTFSRAMAAGHGTVSLNGEPLNGSGSWTNDTTYSIPYAGLDCSKLYTIGISGFQDTRGSVILENTDYSFTTEARPYVLSITPVYNSAGVAASGSLTVTFSRAMAAGHGTVTLNGEALTGNGSWADDMTYSIPYAALNYNTLYTVGVSGFQDMRGSLILDNTDYSFTTEVKPLLPTISKDSLTLYCGDTVKFTVAFGQGTAAANSATIAVKDSKTAEANPIRLSSPGAVAVSGRIAGTTSLTVIFDDNNNTSVTIPIKVFSLADSPSIYTNTDNSDNTETATATVTGATNSDGVTSATVPSNVMQSLLNEAQAAEGNGRSAILDIHVAAPSSATSTEVTIPGGILAEISNRTDAAVRIDSGPATLTFNAEATASISSAAGINDIKINVKKVDALALSAEVQRQVGSHPVYNFSVEAGGSVISSFGGGSAMVSIPYQLAEGEDASKIVVYCISDSGEFIMVPNCVYDAAIGTVTFTTTHFSNYTVGYSSMSFTDVSGWYEDYVYFLAARDIVNGTGNGKFSPDKNITRAQFVTILANLSGDDISGYKTSSFVDVKPSDWYFKAVQWAYEKGIAAGTGGKFDPNDNITRQDIAVMIARYAKKVANYALPETNGAVTFTDSSDISSYTSDAVMAVQRAGLISGYSDGSFAPAANATRAQVAKIIALLLQGMIGN